jgi:hypothetical protein
VKKNSFNMFALSTGTADYKKVFTHTILGLFIIYFIIFSGSAAQRGLWPLRSRGFVITHNDAPQSVGLLWTSDQLVAETST